MHQLKPAHLQLIISNPLLQGQIAQELNTDIRTPLQWALSKTRESAWKLTNIGVLKCIYRFINKLPNTQTVPIAQLEDLVEEIEIPVNQQKN